MMKKLKKRTKKKRNSIPGYIFDKDAYRSILNLLINFQNKEFQGAKGLRPIQFRFVLEQGYKNSKKPLAKFNIKMMKTFFGDELDLLIKSRDIAPGCITSRQNLVKFLNNLKNPPISAIEKIGSKPDVRYFIKKEFETLKEQRALKSSDIFAIKTSPTVYAHVDEFPTPIRIYGINEEFLQHAEIFGLRKRILDGIRVIEKKASDINFLKHEVTVMYKTRLFIDECKKLDDEELKNFVKTNLDDIIGAIFLANPEALNIIDITKRKKKKRAGTFRKIEALDVAMDILLSKKAKAYLSNLEKSDKRKDKKFKLSLLNLMEKVYNADRDLYGLGDIESLITVVVYKPRFDNSQVDKDLDLFKSEILKEL